MIRLSRLTDYGILLMAHLAERGEPGSAVRPKEPRNAREVAGETRLPLPVASKVLKSLARQGLLVSHRGSKGGYSLSRPPREITVAQMIAALEGPLGLTECTAHPGACAQEPSCHVREPWQRINRAVADTLASVTLADLVRPRELAAVGTAPPAPGSRKADPAARGSF